MEQSRPARETWRLVLVAALFTAVALGAMVGLLSPLSAGRAAALLGRKASVSDEVGGLEATTWPSPQTQTHPTRSPCLPQLRASLEAGLYPRQGPSLLTADAAPAGGGSGGAAATARSQQQDEQQDDEQQPQQEQGIHTPLRGSEQDDDEEDTLHLREAAPDTGDQHGEQAAEQQPSLGDAAAEQEQQEGKGRRQTCAIYNGVWFHLDVTAGMTWAFQVRTVHAGRRRVFIALAGLCSWNNWRARQRLPPGRLDLLPLPACVSGRAGGGLQD